MWLARDKDGYLILFEYKPKKIEDRFIRKNHNDSFLRIGYSNICMECTWENSPIKVKSLDVII